MGMYDYLEDEQVKMFYRPIFSNESVEGEIGTWHSGGSLMSYTIGEELPLKTLYYQYPDNFIVFDLQFSVEKLFIVENGILKDMKPISKLVDGEVERPVFNKYGTQLNIESKQDFYDYSKECMAVDEKVSELRGKHFPKGIMAAIRKDYEEYEKQKVLFEKEREDTLAGIKTKEWYVEDLHILEKDFGEAIDCYIYSKGIENDGMSSDSIRLMNDVDAVKSLLKKLMKENEGIVEKYKQWLCDEEWLKVIGFEDILVEVQW